MCGGFACALGGDARGPAADACAGTCSTTSAASPPTASSARWPACRRAAGRHLTASAARQRGAARAGGALRRADGLHRPAVPRPAAARGAALAGRRRRGFVAARCAGCCKRPAPPRRWPSACSTACCPARWSTPSRRRPPPAAAPLPGLLTMVAFGLGTFPAMLAMGGLGLWLRARRRAQPVPPRFRRAASRWRARLAAARRAHRRRLHRAARADHARARRAADGRAPALGMNAAAACSHCRLPVGRARRSTGSQRRAAWFCCYGCCLAFQVHHGESEEPEAAALLIRLGVGAFLAMNIMLFSLLLYAGAFGGDDAWLRSRCTGCCGSWRRRCWCCWAGRSSPAPGRRCARGRLATDTLVSARRAGGLRLFGLAGAARLRRWSTSTPRPWCWCCSRWAATWRRRARARAARSLAPMLAAERAEARVWRRRRRDLRPVARGAGRRPGARAARRAHRGGRRGGRGPLRVRRGGAHRPAGAAAPRRRAARGAPAASTAAASCWCAPPPRACDTRWVQISRMVREALARKSLLGDTRRPRRRRLHPVRAAAGLRHRLVLERARRPRRGAAGRPGGAGGGLPLFAGPGRAAGRRAGDRPGGAARHPGAQRRRAGEAGAACAASPSTRPAR